MKKLFTFLAIFIPISLFSQENKILDSLKRALANSPDTHKVTILNALSHESKSIDLDLALNYSLNALELSKKINNQKKIAESYFYLSSVHLFRQENKQAEEYIQKALELFRSMKNPTWISKCLIGLAILHQNKRENSSAMHIYRSLLDEKRKEGDSVIMVVILNNLGNIYCDKGEFDSAQTCYYQALAIHEKKNDLQGIAQSLSVIASLYSYMEEHIQAIDIAKRSLNLMMRLNNKSGVANNLYTIGLSYYETSQYDSSKFYLEDALRIYQEIGDVQSVTDSKFMLGNVFFEKKEYPKAKQYCYEALEESRDSEDLLRKGYAFSIMANILCDAEQNYQQAKMYADSSLVIFQQIDAKYYLLPLYKLLASIAVKTGEYQKAHSYLSSGMSLKDSIFKHEKAKLVLELDKKYEAEKKQQLISRLTHQTQIQMLELDKKNWQLYGLVGGILTLLLFISIGLLFIRQKKLLAARKGLELEQRLLRAQMNPHFIFNSLTAVQGFINTDKKNEAGTYLSKVSKLIRAILENSREEYVSFEKELQCMENYLSVNQLLMDNQFEYRIYVDEDINKEQTAIPPMMAQPFIENALKHGIQNKQEKGFITVRFKKKASSILFEVEDNGVGLTKREIGTGQKHESLATIITKERLANLLRTSFDKVTITIQEIKDVMGTVSGTKTIFEIPAKYL